MRMITHIFRMLLLFVTIFVAVSSTGGAVEALYEPIDKDLCAEATANNNGTAPASCDETGDDPLTRTSGKEGIIFRAVRLVVMATAVVSVIMIMLGGFTYIMSGGEPQKIDAAKNTILYAIIGLVIAVSAQMIVSFVLVKL